MEELLKQILVEVKDIKKGQNSSNDKVQALTDKVQALSGKVEVLTDKVEVLEEQVNQRFNQVNNRFNSVDKKLDIVYNAVADLMEFRTDAEQKLKKVR